MKRNMLSLWKLEILLARFVFYRDIVVFKIHLRRRNDIVKCFSFQQLKSRQFILYFIVRSLRTKSSIQKESEI